ncbi:MAG: hypothetical protein LBQ51_10585 [Desulfovibrio sp.]|jgi:tetratricopeptide (TPR) repeat protein|nr:hypothetical protein [Desulfovibrio sp.]
MSQPAPNTEEVVNLVNALGKKWDKPTSFELARLDNEIKKLQNSDITAAECFRGMYYALQNDLENACKWFNAAIQREPSNPYTYMNYSSGLLHMGHGTEALAMSLESIKKGLEIPKQIDNLLYCAYQTDNRALIDEWLPKYKALTGKDHEVSIFLEEDAEDEAMLPELIAQAHNEEPIPWSQVKRELGL